MIRGKVAWIRDQYMDPCYRPLSDAYLELAQYYEGQEFYGPIIATGPRSVSDLALVEGWLDYADGGKPNVSEVKGLLPEDFGCPYAK